MIKKKKKILYVVAACAALAIIVIVIILNMPAYRLKLKPDDIPITVSVCSEQSVLDSFFSPGFMGQSYDYEIVVKEKRALGSTLLKRSFTFASDGAPIHEYNISVESENETVIIRISGSEMQDKVFEVQLD